MRRVSPGPLRFDSSSIRHEHSGSGCLSLLTASRVGSRLEDGLDLEADRDLVADPDAAVQRDGEVDAEVAPVDLRGRGEADPRPPQGSGPNPFISTVSGTRRFADFLS